MTRETCKGRTITARALKGNDAGHTEVKVNGVSVWTYPGKTEAQVIEQTRRDIDVVDADSRPGAYADHWYPTAHTDPRR